MHRFLEIPPLERRGDASKSEIRRALEILGRPKKENLNWKTGSVDFTFGGKAQTLQLADLLQETLEHGIPLALYRLIDSQDNLFGTNFLMATTSKALSIQINLGSFSTNLKGPCRASPVQDDLTSDILHFRTAACDTSGDDSFYDCTRHYRSFLQSCISLIDCFINRYCLTKSQDQLPEELKSASKFDKKVELWVKTFTNRDFTELTASKEWAHCCELRRERNQVVHAVAPYHGVAISNLPTFLNYSRTGIGGLLLKLREFRGESTLGFIERLRSAPEIRFVSRG